MKTRQYVFTEVEILALRECTIEYYQTISKKALECENISPIAKKMHQAVKELKEQFRDDCNGIILSK